jgi:hypothetical protein
VWFPLLIGWCLLSSRGQETYFQDFVSTRCNTLENLIKSSVIKRKGKDRDRERDRDRDRDRDRESLVTGVLLGRQVELAGQLLLAARLRSILL